MSDAREDDLLTTDAGGSGTGDALTPEGAGRRPQPGTTDAEGAATARTAGLVTDPADDGRRPRESADHGQSGGDEQSPDSAGSGRDA